jgi:hypothetical protein
MRITEQEDRTRLAKLQSQVAAHDLDAFLISSKDSIFSLSFAGRSFDEPWA